MPKIKYIEHNGKEHEVEVPAGWSVMEGAVKNLIPGIDADCGGACACATCHVYVDPSWTERVGQRTANEVDMLNSVDELRDSSRLACQITLAAAHDGLEIHSLD